VWLYIYTVEEKKMLGAFSSGIEEVARLF
jgi:hypothetical protein